MGKDRLGTDGEVLEVAWQHDIVQAATLTQWLVHHIHDSRKSIGDGFPDLVLAKPGHATIYAELKRHDGRLSEKQCAWLDVLCQTPGSMCYVWVADKLLTGNHHWQEVNDILLRGPASVHALSEWEVFRVTPDAKHHLPRAHYKLYMGAYAEALAGKS